MKSLSPNTKIDFRKLLAIVHGSLLLTGRALSSDASNETRKKHPYTWIPRDVSIKMQLSLCAIMAS